MRRVKNILTISTLALIWIGTHGKASARGGIIQEIKPAPNSKKLSIGTSKNALIKSKKEEQTKQSKKEQTKQPKKKYHCSISIRYYRNKNVVILNWNNPNKNYRPIKYLIYRWREGQKEHPQLIAILPGNAVSYRDHLEDIQLRYYYRVVGIFQIKKRTFSHKYPILTLSQTKTSIQEKKTTEEQINKIPMGFGCSALDKNPNKYSPLYFLLLLPLAFPLFRGKKQRKKPV